MQKLRAEMVSNVMLLITVVFGGVLSVGGGVWERLHSVHVMNSTSPEPVCYNTVQQGSARRAAEGRCLASSLSLQLTAETV